MSAISLHDGAMGDLGEVMTSMCDAFHPAFGEAWTRGQCAGVLSLGGVWLLLARIDGDPAGFAMTRDAADESELLLLAVRQPHRRRGVGRALLERAIDAAKARGIAHVHLEVRDGNGAIELYRAAGFEQIGRRKAYYRGGDGLFYDALTMSLPVVAR